MFPEAAPQSFSARAWADAFLATVKENPNVPTDRATMFTWFANALMRGYDEATGRAVKKNLRQKTDLSNALARIGELKIDRATAEAASLERFEQLRVLRAELATVNTRLEAHENDSMVQCPDYPCASDCPKCCNGSMLAVDAVKCLQKERDAYKARLEDSEKARSALFKRMAEAEAKLSVVEYAKVALEGQVAALEKLVNRPDPALRFEVETFLKADAQFAPPSVMDMHRANLRRTLNTDVPVPASTLSLLRKRILDLRDCECNASSGCKRAQWEAEVIAVLDRLEGKL